MLHRFTSRYSAVMSTVAVFAAMTGSAYALTVGSSQIANNSIRSVDIRTAEVMSSDIKNNDVKGSDIKNGTLTKNDFAPGVLTSGGGGPVPAGGDAATLGGVAKEGFQPAGVLLRGLGHTDAPSKEVVIDIPDLGIQIQTDGDIDHEHRVFVKNTGGVNIKLSSNISQAEAQMGPNTSVGNLLPAADGKAGLELSIVHQNDPAKGATIDCGFHDSPNVVHCSAVRFG